MPPRRDRRRDGEEEADANAEQFFDARQAEADQPPPLAPRAQVNFRNLDSYKFDKLTKFDRPAYLLFARKFRHTTARCQRDEVTPTPLQELFDPSIIGRVMKAAGLGRQDRDEFGAAWVGLDQDELQTSLNAHFLGHATQQEQQQLFEDVPFPSFSNFESLQVSYETFCADWHRLAMDLVRAAEALEDPAPPLAPSTRTKVLVAKLSLHCSVFLHLFKAKKFDDEDAVLDLIDPYLDGVVLFQRQHHGCPGISWPAISGGDQPPVKQAKQASTNNLDAPALPEPALKPQDPLVAAVHALVAKLGGGAAAQPAKATPVCSHCGGRHDVTACWFRHVKKPKGGGHAIVTPEEREKTRLSRGLPAVQPKRASRANSPHPRARPESSDSEVNSDAWPIVPPPRAPLAARVGVGERDRGLRRRRARDSRIASFHAFGAELEAAGIPAQPLPLSPPSTSALRRHARNTRLAPRSPAAKQAAAAARVCDAEADTAERADVTALSLIRLSSGDVFTDACSLLDTGTSHNFVRPSIAESFIAAGARTRFVPRIVKAGGHLVGQSSKEVELLVTRERHGVQAQTREWAITFDAGFDCIIGLPALQRWGWVSFDGVRRPTAQANAITAERLVSRSLSGVRLSRAARTANATWAAVLSVAITPRALALATTSRIKAASIERRAHEIACAGAVSGDWRQRLPPAIGCLRGSRARDTQLLPSPYEPEASQSRSVRFLILGPTLREQRAEAAVTQRARKMMRAGARVIPIGPRLFRVAAARPSVSRRAGTRQQCTIFSLDAPRSNFQLKEDQARTTGDDVRADFFHRLDSLCRRWGYFDGKRIFSADLTTPSKMSPMRIKLMGGARRMPMRLAMRRHSQPQKDEVRKQLITMLKQLVAERAGPDAWMSCVHLVRKPDAPIPAAGHSEAAINALAAMGGLPDAASMTLHMPCISSSKSASGSGNGSGSGSGNGSGSGSGSGSVTSVELDVHTLQRWADSCGSNGAMAMEIATLFSMEADIQVGSSQIRWRFTIDFRKLNEVTVEEFYPFPETRECIESLAGDELFGSLDLSSMYWQIEVHPDDRHLTGFATEDGCFIFRRVPFGLKNACAHAQKEFRAVLRSDARLDSVNNYLDDCFWGTRGDSKYEAFLHVTQALFEVCEKFNVKINAAKTFLGEDSLRVLGHRVDKHGMHIDPARQSALVGLDTPAGKTGLQQVKAALGAMQYVRSFIPSFSTVAAPLTGMTTFTWGREQALAWAELKRLIQTSGVLCNPNYDQPFYLKADASKRGLGGCLYQWGARADGSLERRVIAYCSKKFCKRESDWKTIEQECFSVVYSLQKFRPLIQGCKVTVLNDHRNLVWLRSNESSSKCVRWSMVLDEYSIVWRHLPGKATLAQEEDATVPDGLSRSFGSSPVAPAAELMSDREERLLTDLDVQLSALSVESAVDGLEWDSRAPLTEQMAVLVMCMEACRQAEPALIFTLNAERAARIAARDAIKKSKASHSNAAGAAAASAAAAPALAVTAAAAPVTAASASATSAVSTASAAAASAALAAPAMMGRPAEAGSVVGGGAQVAGERAAAVSAEVASAAAALSAAMAAAAAASAAAATPAILSGPAVAASAGSAAATAAASSAAVSERQKKNKPPGRRATANAQLRVATSADSAATAAAAAAASAAEQARQPRVASPVVAAANAAADRPAQVLAPPSDAAALAASSRAMLAAARRLANAGRLMAREDAAWQHNRASPAPDSYSGQILQRERWQGHEAAARLPEDAGSLQKWSELGEAEKRAAFEQAHCFPASHAGALPTRDRIIRRGKFSLARGELERMLEDVRTFKAACPTCQLLRKWDQEDETLSSIPARPWVDVSVDFLMVSPTDHLGHIAILIVEDNFSGACELIPVKSITAEVLARECVKVFGRTNAPITIRSDQGPAFESLVNNALMRAMGVVQHRVLHGHHRANGIVERTNSDVVRMLRACVLDPRVVPSALISWAELCPWLQRSINRSMSSKTRKAPVTLLFGDRVDLDRELFDPLPENFTTGPAVKIGGYVQALIDSYDGCLQAALAYQAAQLERVVASRRLVPEMQFVPGEWVILRLPPDQVHDKMEPRWEGPFRVLARTGDHSYTVLDTVRAAERRIRDVHVTSVCRFDWTWLEIPADDEAARSAYAAKLAVRAAARPMGTPCTLLAIRQKKTIRELPLEAGRGVIPLSKLEFRCAFTEIGVQDAWVPFNRLDGGDFLTAFLLANRNWR